jgi:hypothetical protein
MRQLTAKQKKLLKKTLDKDVLDKIHNVDTLPYSVWVELEEMNDTEILYQMVNEYISDYIFSDAYDKRNAKAV